MQELKPGLTVEQLEKLRVKAYRASQKAHDIWFRDKWLQIAESARTMRDALDITVSENESTYSAGISEDTESLQANDRLTATGILGLLRKGYIGEHADHNIDESSIFSLQSDTERTGYKGSKLAFIVSISEIKAGVRLEISIMDRGVREVIQDVHYIFESFDDACRVEDIIRTIDQCYAHVEENKE